MAHPADGGGRRAADRGDHPAGALRHRHHRHGRRRPHLAPDRGHRSLLGVVGTGVAYVLNFRIIADLGATRASLVTYLIPIVAVAVGVVVLDEPFGWRIVAGGVLIIAGIVPRERLGGRAPPRGHRGGDRAPRRAARRVRRRRRRSAAGGVRPGRAPSRSTASTSCTCSPVRPTRTTAPTRRPPVPHQPTPPVEGVVTKPLSRPVQVGLLEEGRVLLQHDGLSARPTATRLEALAGDDGGGRPEPRPPRRRRGRRHRVGHQADLRASTSTRSGVRQDHAGKGPGAP